MAKAMVILRTDSGQIIGSYRTVREAQTSVELDRAVLRHVLVIQAADGVVLSRRWPDLEQTL